VIPESKRQYVSHYTHLHGQGSKGPISNSKHANDALDLTSPPDLSNPYERQKFIQKAASLKTKPHEELIQMVLEKKILAEILAMLGVHEIMSPEHAVEYLESVGGTWYAQEQDLKQWEENRAKTRELMNACALERGKIRCVCM
jgi:hypothetical protein